MNSEENTNLDLLDLDGDNTDTLPEVAFTTPRPKKPWLLLGIGLVVIALATYIIVRTVSSGSSSTVEIDLDAEPEVVVDGGEMPKPMPMPPVPMAQGQQPMPPAPMAQGQQPMPPAPNAVKPAPVQEPDVRVVEDRRDVVFNPNKVSEETKPVVKTETKPAAKTTTAKTTTKSKTTTKTSTTKATGTAAWYVQFGSYATRDAANAAGAKMRAEHASLFSGKQFVVLASVLKDGRTTYRLRVAFNTAGDANGFCRNAKSDGLDCYVAK